VDAFPVCGCPATVVGKEKISVKRKNSSIFTKKTEKRKPIPQGRREGMSSFLLKILPEVRGWRFLIKPGGLELYRPVRRLIFAFLFWFLSFPYLLNIR
jgi:hypothetical protein